MQPDGFWQDVLLMAFDNRKDGRPRLALAMSHRRVDFLNLHLEPSERRVSRVEAGFSGNLRFFAIIVRLP